MGARVPELRHAMSALRIPIGGLTTGRAMEIEQHPQAMLPAPADHAVQQAKTLLAPVAGPGVGFEMPVAEGQPHVVKPELPDSRDILLSEVVFHVGIPERGRFLRTEYLDERFADRKSTRLNSSHL